jgi:2,4-dienoyl-CoA reductase-like NADH-dependent reductase (Old Yellow Enzyme family)
MIEQPLTLPSGAVLPNRLAKAPMTERLADPLNRATPELVRLYEVWARGGAGLQITGNIPVDRDHPEAVGNVVMDEFGDLDALRPMAAAARAGGAPAWAQISHAGRQTPKVVNPHPKAPSAVPLARGGVGHGEPVAMTEADIEEAIRRFGVTAELCQRAGFDGVQIHGAHGYLLSSFLNPNANKRTDRWGGSLENRARALLGAVAACRRACGDGFPVSVKLNSADFQEGGFTLSECATVAGWLADAGVDLLEVSGGNYEQPAMIVGRRDERRDSTKAREAFFLDYAAELKESRTPPLMVSGGFRTREAMEAALASGAADVIGLGRPIVLEPDLPARLIAGEAEAAADWEAAVQPRHAVMAWYYQQIWRVAHGQAVDPSLTGEEAWEVFRAREAAQAEAHRRPEPA